MEISEILPSIIAGVASIVVAVLAFIVGRYNSKSDKQSSVLEQQYTKVISPIHHILRCGSKAEIRENVNTVIENQYHLLPDNFWNEYDAFLLQITHLDDSLSGIEQLEFYRKVDQYFRVLRYELKYSNTKRPKKKKAVETRIPIYKNKGKRSILLFLLTCSLFIYYIITIYNLVFIQVDIPLEFKWQRTVILVLMMIMLILIYLLKR